MKKTHRQFSSTGKRFLVNAAAMALALSMVAPAALADSADDEAMAKMRKNLMRHWRPLRN